VKLLIIGGTLFVGRALTEAALARGHDVTLFHRGYTNANIFPEAERIIGDRDGQLAHLGEREWDAVVDTCGFVPRVVRSSAEYLRERVGRYAFISTISVYAEGIARHADESAPLAGLTDPHTEEVSGETYGGLKVLCEQIVDTIYGERGLNIRPGLIVGPYDPTNRFTDWVRRIARGGDVVVPPDPHQPIQFIDARDLAEFTLTLLENDASGAYHATGPVDAPLTLGSTLKTMIETVGGPDVRLRPATSALLRVAQVQPWTELPLYTGDDAALMTLNLSKARAAGLTTRPLATTIRDTLGWVQSLPGNPPGRAGLAPDRELALLQAMDGPPQA